MDNNINIPTGILMKIGGEIVSHYDKAKTNEEKAFYIGMSVMCATLIRDKNKPYIAMNFNYEDAKKSFVESVEKPAVDSKAYQINIDELLEMLNELGVDVKKKDDKGE